MKVCFFFHADFVCLLINILVEDIVLISQYKSTQNKEFVGELFKRYSHLVFGSCMKYFKDEAKAQDASMEIFEKLLIDLLRFDIQYFKSWLFTYTRNFCLMQLRKKTGEVSMGEIQNFESQLMEKQDSEHLTIEKEEELTTLEKGIAHLNEEQRVCVELFYLKEKSYQDVADETGFELKKVKSYIQNGKRNLRIYILNNKELIVVIAFIIF